MHAVPPSPILRLQSGPLAGKVYDLRSSMRIGRHPYNEVSLDEPAVSRYHCWIRVEGSGAYLEDLASANGTFLNDAPVRERTPLRLGDRIRVGAVEILFSEEAA